MTTDSITLPSQGRDFKSPQHLTHVASLHERGKHGWPVYQITSAGRAKLLALVKHRPGLSFRDVARSMEMSSEPLRWQLDILLAERKLIEVPSGSALRYFPNDEENREVAEACGYLIASEAAYRLMEFVTARPGCRRKEALTVLASGGDLSLNAFIHALKRLQDLEAVLVDGPRRARSLTPTARGRDSHQWAADSRGRDAL